jgi:Asp-tRNA(Asn)/Glu-tRNA(Gln) amidotransferase B subunit
MAGKITGLVMKDHKGKVDPGLVSKVIRAKLG